MFTFSCRSNFLFLKPIGSPTLKMSESTVEVILLSSDVEDCENSPESVSKSSTTAIDKKSTDSENSNATSTSDSHNNTVSEILNVSSDSEISSPYSDNSKQNTVSHTTTKPVNDSPEGNSVVDMFEENSTVDKNAEHSGVDKIVENPAVDVIDENLSDISDDSSSSSSEDMPDDNCGDISEIPCLDLLDDVESHAPRDSITLLGFDMKPYSVPDSERYGNCRLISEFEKISYMGEGSCGVVYKVLDLKYETIVALKKMKISLNSDDPLSVHVMREINILKSLDHPNIVNSRGVAVGGNFDSTYLILDCCDYDLARVIDDEKASSLLEEPQIKCIMLQLLEGLKYIHRLCIVHRDLSCSNILFTDEGILKIGDFGLSRLSLHEEEMSPNVGSRWYRSIELLLGSIHYSYSTDLWSAGCIFAEVILKKPLFKAKSDMGVISLIIDLLGSPNEATWPDFSQLPVLELYELRKQEENNLALLFADKSKLCLHLLNEMFTFNPKERISAAEALLHLYFSEDPHTCPLQDLVKILEVTNEIPEPVLPRVEDEEDAAELASGEMATAESVPEEK